MKKLVVLAMVAAMSLSMAACGNNTTTNNGKENTEQASGSEQTGMQELVEETRTIIIYEAPHHLIKTLKELRDVLGGDRRINLCRELTKHYEEKWLTTIDGALAGLETNGPRGEYVMVIEGRSLDSLKQEKIESFSQMSVQEHMEIYLSQGIDRKEAMKKVAKDRGVSKRDIYQELL